MGRRLRDRLLTLVMTAAVFIGTYWLGLVLFPVGLNWANRNINFQLGRDALDWIRQLGAFGVAAGAAAVTGRTALRLLSRRGREPGDELLVRAAHFLARRSLIEATHNPVRTRLYRPMPLRVRLRSVGGAIAAGRSAVTGEDNTTWEQEPIHTHVDRLMEMFLMLPQRQLVMVGEAGAGKSVMALLLTHQLLQRWHPDEPVPVLLSTPSWDPRRETVDMYLSRRLQEDHGFSPELAGRLSREPRLGVPGPTGFWTMPILDGVDEVAAERLAACVQRIEDFTEAGHPIVITCRTHEFRRAVAKAGVLSRAAVIGLEPLDVEEVIRFLSDPRPGSESWQPVFDRLRADPGGALSRVLTSPLMVTLAKDGYAFPDSNPAKLLSFTTRDQILHPLIDEYIRAKYRHDTLPRAVSSPRRYRPDDAIRWLGSLAYLLYRNGTRDLRWWALDWSSLATRPALFARLVSVVHFGVVALIAGLVLRFISDAAMWAQVAMAALFAASIAWWAKARRARWPVSEPRSTLRANHVLALRIAVRFGILGAVVASVAAALTGHSVADWTLAGALALTVSAWLAAQAGWMRFRLAHLALVLNAGLLPFRLMTFLSDGTDQRRGILRTSGNAWQFRHALIQDYLVGRARLSVLRRRARADNAKAIGELVELLRAQGNLGEAAELLRRPRKGAEGVAALKLAELFREQGYLAEAAQVLRHHADTGAPDADSSLAEVLRELGDVDGLRERAEAGSVAAALQLMRSLRERGDAAELRQRADADEVGAAYHLARMLREQGNLEELRVRAEEGDEHSASALAELRQDNAGTSAPQERPADRPAEAGNPDAGELAGVLRDGGDVAGLRKLAQAGSRYAARELAGLLRDLGDEPGLRQQIDAGNRFAVGQLAGLLNERGDGDGAAAVLRRQAGAGDLGSASRLAGLLRERGDAAGLRQQASAGNHYAASELASLLRERGDVAGLRELADAGNRFAVSQLAELLRERGDLDEAIAVMRHRADAGDTDAGYQLEDLLRQQEPGD